MRRLFFIVVCLIFSHSLLAQKKEASINKSLTPFAGVFAGGCVDNPFSFLAGVQKTLKDHITLSYDIHYWNTKYECYCDNLYSKGKFSSITPSVKMAYNTGKKEGKGLIAVVGLGYMFARDRGTEQSYRYDVASNTNMLNDKDISKQNWDFNSLAPSFGLGVGFRVMKMPVSFQSIYYFAKTKEGWMAAAGGVGFKIGLRKVPGACCEGRKKCK